MLATDVAYPRIYSIKLNARWQASETPVDRATGEFTKWYIFAPEKHSEGLNTQPDPSAEPVTLDNWLSNNDLVIGVIRVSEAEQEGFNTDGTRVL
ncbi:hypothetical protein E4T56_gene412 [Termitomyces sp. T112]|nr:hypothetical protein E4T56_gene412 [Termitomyces sp. T112]